MEKTVLPIHFEDRSGTEFERLCFAYIIRIKEWEILDWLGQSGSEGGRDIWGKDKKNNTYCYQCANYQRLNFSKPQEDIDKLIKNKTIPDNFILICGGRVSAKMKKKIENYAKSKEIKYTETWTGGEFEEKLRKDTPELIRRFSEGEEFPDSPENYSSAFNIKSKPKDKEEYFNIFSSALFDISKKVSDTVDIIRDYEKENLYEVSSDSMKSINYLDEFCQKNSLHSSRNLDEKNKVFFDKLRRAIQACKAFRRLERKAEKNTLLDKTYRKACEFEQEYSNIILELPELRNEIIKEMRDIINLKPNENQK